MKRVLSVVFACAASLALSGTVLAAPPLQTFGTGSVDVTSRDSATITNGAGEYAGVYVRARSLSNRPLAETDFSFVSTGDTAGGAPRFSIPIDTDGDASTTELYAFMAADRCGGSSGQETWVSTENTDCIVDLNTGGTYANWDALAAANPTWVISKETPFIISDQPGVYEVSEIDLQ